MTTHDDLLHAAALAQAEKHDTHPPYAPRVDYLCDDPDCCRNGCPVVVCRVCGKSWPCADYQAAHTPAQVARQERWVENVWGDGA